MMTDPIADMLTRIRNGVAGAPRPQSRCPRSQARSSSIAEILKDEGFIADYDVADDDKQGMLEIVAALRRADPRTNAIDGMRRVSRPGQRVYVRHGTIPQGPHRPGHRDPLHVAGRDDRPGGPQARASAASSSARSGEEPSCRASDEKSTRRSPRASRVDARRPCVVSVKGPKGELDARPSRRASTIKIEARQGHVVLARGRRARRTAPTHGLMRALLANMVKGVTDGLRRASSRSTASATAPRSKGKTLDLALGFSHPVDVPAARRASRAKVEQEHRRHPDRRRQGAARPDRGEDPRASVRPSRTRARASSTGREAIREKVGKAGTGSEAASNESTCSPWQ